jgi:hypothetical protein
MVTEAVFVAPPESVTLAVIVWVPPGSFLATLPPVPIGPLTLDDHAIELVRSPSSKSDAEAENAIVSAVVYDVAFAGEAIEIVGGVFVTVIETVAVRVMPPESVMLAVTVCVPLLRRLVKLPPVPMGPSMLDVHAIADVTLPSSASVAVAWKAIEFDVLNVAPLAGAWIEMAGGAFVTVMVTESFAATPSASTTRRRIVCVPADSRRLKLPPVPIAPSMLDVHAIDPVRSPSSTSLAEARNAIWSPVENVLPPAGLARAICGGVSATVIVIDAVAVSPPESVTVAVMTCVPLLRRLETMPPLPSGPSTLDVHAIDDCNAPSSASDADAARSMTSFVWNDDPSAGDVIETVGAVFERVTVTVSVAVAVAPRLSVALAVIVCEPGVKDASTDHAPVGST